MRNAAELIDLANLAWRMVGPDGVVFRLRPGGRIAMRRVRVDPREGRTFGIGDPDRRVYWLPALVAVEGG